MAGLLWPATRSACRSRTGQIFFPATSPLFVRVCQSLFHSSATRSRSLIHWTPELDSRISQLQAEGHTWKQIGESLHLSPFTCYRRYHACIAPELFKFWTPKRNKRLYELALEGNKTWSEIAKDLSSPAFENQHKPRVSEKKNMGNTISGIACQQQWYVITEQSFRRRCLYRHFKKWDQDLLRQCLMADPQTSQSGQSGRLDIDWNQVAERVFSHKFTVQQIHYQSGMLLQDQKRWTKREDAALIDHVMERIDDDGNLSEIIWLEATEQQNLRDHSPEDCRNRWDVLESRMSRRSMISTHGNLWNDDEIEAYWIAWQRFGNDWDRVAQAIQSTPEGMPVKTPNDCKNDFELLRRLSIPKAPRLKPFVGKLAQCFSAQPRRRIRWTQEQLERLEHAVVLESGSSDILANIDWNAVANRVGDNITAGQCRYRMSVIHNARNVVEANSTCTGRWNLKDSQALTRALDNFQLLGVTDQLPRRFTNFVQNEYSLNRTHTSIWQKAKSLLKRTLLEASEGTPKVRLKRRLYLEEYRQSLDSSTTGDESYSDSSLPDVPQDNPQHDNRSSNDDPEHSIKSILDDTTTSLEEQLADEDDMELEHLHAEMFIAPGILKTDVRRHAPTSRSRRNSNHVVWGLEDEEKLKKMVKKYGTSTLGWKQIALELSIPVRKCKDKWRNSSIKAL